MSLESTPIQDHTLTTLCDELVSGRSVLDDTGATFSLSYRDSRAAFQWFRQNTQLWTKSNSREYAEQLASALEIDPLVLPSRVAVQTGEARRYRLKSVKVSRFAGLHEFGNINKDPEPLEIDFTAGSTEATLFYGKNGSGKSSLLSAICWGLTGWYFRPQGPPESGKNAIEFSVEASPATSLTATGEAMSLKALPIIPLLDEKTLRSLRSSPATVETWVEIELIDDGGNCYGPFRRTARLNRSKTDVQLHGDFSKLGISPADFEVGTRLPAMLPYISLDEKSDFGQAVAKLVDIQPLVDVSRHAEKSIEKLEDDFIHKLNDDADQLELKRITELAGLEADAIQIGVASISDQLVERPIPITTNFLDEVKATVEHHRGETLQGAREVLGDSFNVDEPEHQRQFIADVTNAEQRLLLEEIEKLPSVQRWDRLAQLSANELENTEALLARIESEAKTLDELQRSPDRAARIRLYAKVAGWLKDENHSVVDECPLCGQDMKEVNDPITGQGVQSHLSECLNTKTMAWEKTIPNWIADTRTKLQSELPKAIRLDELPSQPITPTDFLLDAIGSELFQPICFRGSLQPLKTAMQKRLAAVKETLPKPTPISLVKLPDAVHDSGEALERELNGIRMAIHHARWIQEQSQLRRDIETALIGTMVATGMDELAEDHSITADLRKLQALIRTAQPLTEFLKRLAGLRTILIEANEVETKIKRYRRTIEALKPLKELKPLVERQVNGLLTRLKSRQDHWLNLIYTPHRLERPTIRSPQLSGDGRFGFRAEHRGTSTAAQHVSNTSYIRASLVAFWLAYWEDQLKQRGGLRVMLLDDPQELFDDENQLRFARAIKAFVDCDAQVILATHKSRFFDDIDTPASSTQRWEIDWQPSQPMVVLLPLLNSIHDRIKAFERSKTDVLGRELAGELRLYIEGRLTALFRHDPPMTLPKKPTRADLANVIRRLKKQGTPPFDGDAFEKLVDHPAFVSNTSVSDLLNDAHHGRFHLISGGQVFNELVELKKLVDLVNRAWDHFHLSRLSTVAELRASRSRVLDQVEIAGQVLPVKCLPRLTATAAAGNETVMEEADLTGDTFDWSQVGNVAVYHVTTASLGWSVPQNYRVIVSLNEDIPENNSLVIAVCGTEAKARRLILNSQQPDIVCLVAEHTDPRKRTPMEVRRTDEVRLLPIVGVIWDETPPNEAHKGEAYLEDYSLERLHIEFAQNARGHSAEPVVLAGQTVLVGPVISWSELSDHINEPVSVELENGNQILKLVGDQTLGKRQEARLLNPIGGLGESLWVRCPINASQSDLQRIAEVRRIRRVFVILY